MSRNKYLTNCFDCPLIFQIQSLIFAVSKLGRGCAQGSNPRFQTRCNSDNLLAEFTVVAERGT